MYMSKWELEEDGTYYQATISLKENLTPFLKLRIIPLPAQKKYNLVVRDYNTGVMLSSINIKMEQRNDGVYTNLNMAKKAIKRVSCKYISDACIYIVCG